jgi:hypothetical protein
MKAERQQKEPQKADPIQSKRERSKLSFVDNRLQVISQMKLVKSIQQNENKTELYDNLKTDLKSYSSSERSQVVQAYFSDATTNMLRQIFIQHVTKYINDIYEQDPGKQFVLDEYIRKANSDSFEGSSTFFLQKNGISVTDVDNYVTFGTLPNQENAMEEEDLPDQLDILNAIRTVAGLPELNDLMDPDRTGEYEEGEVAPQQQLLRCVQVCENLSPEEVAIYLYTTYFYRPLNLCLRNSLGQIKESIQYLINRALYFLGKAFDTLPEMEFTPKFRMELKPSWIGEKGVGEVLSFPGFTSTHPNLDGINNMWDNIENGDFGETEDVLALLVFEGSGKFLRPGTKYFGGEVEDILPCDMTATIIDKYSIQWINSDNRYEWNINVFHLMIGPMTQARSGLRLDFNDAGYICAMHKL